MRDDLPTRLLVTADASPRSWGAQGGSMDSTIFGRYKLFIFDADDTLRRTTAPGKPCPHRPGEWVLMPGVRDRLSQVQWGSAGGPLFGIASNQDQVGYGHLTLTMARNLLRDLAHAAAD